MSSGFTLLFNKLLPKLSSTWYLPEIESPHKDTTFLSPLKDSEHRTFLSTFKDLDNELAQEASQKASEKFKIWRIAHSCQFILPLLWLFVVVVGSPLLLCWQRWMRKTRCYPCLDLHLSPSGLRINLFWWKPFLSFKSWPQRCEKPFLNFLHILVFFVVVKLPLPSDIQMFQCLGGF